MKRVMIAMAAALFAAACQPMPATDNAAAAPTSLQTAAAGSTDAALCERAGGKMQPQGRMQSVRCVITYTDAGQRCTTGSDCQGDCRVEEGPSTAPREGAAVAGTCQRDSRPFGCYTRVENGKAEATLCVD
ncbi:MAG: hypothetical protein REJ23_04125 [Brevundimonas sp.]|nr:hypothetical protein [Brevundimonas sp.]